MLITIKIREQRRSVWKMSLYPSVEKFWLIYFFSTSWPSWQTKLCILVVHRIELYFYFSLKYTTFNFLMNIFYRNHFQFSSNHNKFTHPLHLTVLTKIKKRNNNLNTWHGILIMIIIKLRFYWCTFS
jgi:hypothetical protein